MNNLKIGVLGSGSWATAIIKILQTNNIGVHWYIRNPETLDYIQTYKNNPKYLTSVDINTDLVELSSDVDFVSENCQILILAIPSAFLRDSLENISVQIDRKYFVSAVKGLIPGENILVSEYLQKYFNVKKTQIVALTGPSHAEEVAQERLSYLTFAGKNLEFTNYITTCFHNRFIETVVTEDLEGTEYAGVLKNIYAVAAGISHGLRFGDNYLAVLVANAAQEMEQFLKVLIPQERDIKASAYLGDLLVTAYSQFSRNRTFGSLIGKGHTVRAAQAEMLMVAEGYYATRCIYELNQTYKANMPIVDTVYSILYQSENPTRAFARLNKILR
ncbi:MAG TPA: NAD(P)-binding domain-containing protein [Salinivirgaceae bacterium]|nr:NAD(P)-binding domain-containing protein [Salinivirgaceae bacterium]